MNKIIGTILATVLLGIVNYSIADDAKTNLTDNSNSDSIENSVVKIFSTVTYPDFYRPWTKQPPMDYSGSGVVIDGNRILTCAHVVQYARQVQIQAQQGGDKIPATVVAIAPGIDLALLKLDDESFFNSHPPRIKLESKEAADYSLPNIKDSVTVYGYPTGGDSLSITRGIVSRIDFSSYNNLVYGLRIQIDAAINPGNSGGPVFVGNKMIGLAFSRLNNTQSIGYVIPSEEIELFLQSVAAGVEYSKPVLFDQPQALENTDLRAYLKLDNAVKGIVIHRPYSTAPSYPLHEWDVVTQIGDTPIDNQGMISIGNDLRVAFSYMVQKIAKNGKVPLTIIRDGKTTNVEVPTPSTYLSVTPFTQGAYPSYFICGPLVFTAVTTAYIGGFLSAKEITALDGLIGLGSPLIQRFADKPSVDGESLVAIASPFLPNKLSKGYSSPQSHVIKSINGITIKNLSHLVEVLRDLKDEFIVISFAEKHDTETLVFRRDTFIASTEGILNDNDIRSQGSPDMLEIWNAKPSK